MLRSPSASGYLKGFLLSTRELPKSLAPGPSAGAMGMLYACIVCASSPSMLFYVQETGPRSFLKSSIFARKFRVFDVLK